MEDDKALYLTCSLGSVAYVQTQMKASLARQLSYHAAFLVRAAGSPLVSVLGWCLVLSELLNKHCTHEAGLEREINCQSAKIACGKTHVRKEITS